MEDKDITTADKIKIASCEKKIKDLEEERQQHINNLNSKTKKKFKNRVSESRYRVGLAMHTAPIGIVKDEPRKHVQTDKYEDNILAFAEEYKDFKYFSAGTNSLNRCMIVDDIDDPSVTVDDILKKSMEVFGKYPNAIRCNENTHKQVYYILDEAIYVKEAFIIDERGTLAIENNKIRHKRYMFVVHALNYVMYGDQGFTGYVCQNPLQNSTTYSDEKFSFTEMYVKLKNYLVADFMRKENVPSDMRNAVTTAIINGSLWRDGKKIEKKINHDVIYTDEEKESISLIDEKIKHYNAEIDGITKPRSSKYNNSYDKKYFVATTQVINRNRIGLQRKYNMSDSHITNTLRNRKNELLNEVIDNIRLICPEGTGYTPDEESSRILCDINQILRNMHDTEWDKVGFTPIQRNLSVLSRNKSKQEKMCAITREFALLPSVNLPYTQLSATIRTNLMKKGIDVSYQSIRNFISSLNRFLINFNISRNNLRLILTMLDNFKYCGYSFWHNISNTAINLTKTLTTEELRNHIMGIIKEGGLRLKSSLLSVVGLWKDYLVDLLVTNGNELNSPLSLDNNKISQLFQDIKGSNIYSSRYSDYLDWKWCGHRQKEFISTMRPIPTYKTLANIAIA